MLFDPGTVALHSSSGGGAEPRGYLHMLDLTRINRMLRPIKAKISAIQLDIRTHPSLGFALESSVPDAKASERRSLHSRTQSSSRSTNTHRTPSSPPTCSGTGAGTVSCITVSASSANAATDVLVKRFQSSLTDQFRDVVDKVWWRPFCDDYHLAPTSSTSSIRDMGLKPRSNTLGIMSAFAVGRVVAGLPEDDADIAEKYYHIMPAYMRRFAVLEHLVDLCLTQIRVGQLIVPLTLICARRRADTQTMRLLRHLLECQNQTFQLDLPWAYSVAQMVESGDAWMSSLIRYNARQIFNSQSQKFVAMIEPRHRATMIRLAFEAQMDDSLMISDRTKQTRLHNWSVLLIKDSLQFHEAAENADSDQSSAQNPCDFTLEYMAKRLLRITTNPSEDITFSNSEVEALALGPALHSLYVAATRPPCPLHDAAVDEWIQLLDTRAMSSVRLSDFEAISRSYGTLPNLNALAVLLDGLGLYALSMKLLNRMLNNFAYLERNTGTQDGNMHRITRRSLEDHLHEVEERRRNHASNDGWSYDVMLGDWVQRTPDAKKTVRLRMNDDDDFTIPTRGHRAKVFDFGDDPFDGGSSSQEDHTPVNDRNRGRTAVSANRYPPRNEPTTSTRRISRFSLTPMARPVVPTTECELDNNLLSESDADQDENFELEPVPISPPTNSEFQSLSISPLPSPRLSPSMDGDYYTAGSQDHEESLSEEISSELEDNYGWSHSAHDQTPDITIVSDLGQEDSSDDYIGTQGLHLSDGTDCSDRDEQEEDEEEETEVESVHLASDSDPEYVPSLRLRSPSASPSPPTSYREFLTSVEMPVRIRRLSISGTPRKFADAISSGDEYVYYQQDEEYGQRSGDDDDSNAEPATCPELDSLVGSRMPAPSRRQHPLKRTRRRLKSSQPDGDVDPDSDVSSSSDEYTPHPRKVAIKTPRSRRATFRRNHDSSDDDPSDDDMTYDPSKHAHRQRRTGATRKTTKNGSLRSNGRLKTSDSTLGRSLRSGPKPSQSGHTLLEREVASPRLLKRTATANRRQLHTTENEELSDDNSSESANYSFGPSSNSSRSQPVAHHPAPFRSQPIDSVQKKRRAAGNDDSSDYDPGPRLSKRTKTLERFQTRVYDSEESCVVISDDESEGQRAQDSSDNDREDGNNSYEEVEDSAGSDDDASSS